MGTHGSQQASLRKSCPRNGHKTEGFKKITTWCDKNVSVSSTIVEGMGSCLVAEMANMYQNLPSLLHGRS